MPRALTGNMTERRDNISFAALFVNVTAMMPEVDTCPVFNSHAIRVVKTRVLPEPAPARISADWEGNVTAASCSELRLSRMVSINDIIP